MAVCRPVDLLELRIVAQIRLLDATFQEELQFLQRGIGRRTAMPGNGESTASIGVFEGYRPILAIEPAFQQPREETIPCPEDIKDFDGKTFARHALIKIVRDYALESDRTFRAALADKRRRGNRTNGLQRCHGVRGAAGNVEFFLRTDDQIEEMECRLEFIGHLPTRHIATFAVAMTGDTPQVRPVINVEGHFGTVRTREPKCF